MTILDPFEPAQYPVTEEEIALTQQLFKKKGNEIDEYQAEQEVLKFRKVVDVFLDEYFEKEIKKPETLTD